MPKYKTQTNDLTEVIESGSTPTEYYEYIVLSKYFAFAKDSDGNDCKIRLQFRFLFSSVLQNETLSECLYQYFNSILSPYSVPLTYILESNSKLIPVSVLVESNNNSSHVVRIKYLDLADNTVKQATAIYLPTDNYILVKRKVN